MVAQSFDINDMEQGATWARDLAWINGTLAAPGAPVDLSNVAEIRMQIRKQQQSTILAEVSTLGVGPGIIITDAVNGEFTITFTDEQTSAVTVKKAKYDIEVEWTNGAVDRIMQGNVIFDPNITQDPGEPVLR